MADTETSTTEKPKETEVTEVTKEDDAPTTEPVKDSEEKPATTTTTSEAEADPKPEPAGGAATEQSENADSKQTDSANVKDSEDKAEEPADAPEEAIAGTDLIEIESEEESELSSSDDEEDLLIPDPKKWDITFKLAPFLDNHFILVMVDSLKQQKRILQKQHGTTSPTDDTSTSETKDNEQTVPDRKPTELSLIGEQLMMLYDDADLNKMEFALLSKTCLVDFQLQLSEEGDSSKWLKSDMAQKRESLPTLREKVVERLKALETACGPLIDVLQDGGSAMDFIDEHQFDVDLLLSYCRLRYEVGVYQHTDLLLQHYRNLPMNMNMDPFKKKHALWGILSAQILQNKWDDAVGSLDAIQKQLDTQANINRAEDGAQENEDIYNKIAKAQVEGNEQEVLRLQEVMKQKVDASAGNNVESDKKDNNKKPTTLRQQHLTQTATVMRDRAWMLHWSLFVYFNDSNFMLDSLLSRMSEPKNKNVIETMCPHLLRYYAAAVLIANKASSYLDEVSDIIEAERSNYQDPITEFVRLVARTHNFEGASKMLSYAMDVVKCDFFLAFYQDYFLQYARTTFLYRYCKLYSRISVESLSKLLLMDDMSREEIQLWLINAIREDTAMEEDKNLKNRAKLDVVENVIHVYFEGTNPYQKMKDRINSLNTRTMNLIGNVDTRLQEIEDKKNAD